MKTVLSYLFVLAVCLTLTGCPGDMCLNPNPQYSFAVTAHFTPEKDSIRVGDTLYLVSEFPSTMIPIREQEPINYSNSTGIGNTLGVLKLESNKMVKDAVFDLMYFNVNGEIYNSKDIPSPERVQQLRYEEKSDKYILTVGIIPQKKGIFLLGIGNGFSNGRKKDDKCTKASFETSLVNINPNLHYYESWLGSPDNSGEGNRFFIKVY